MRSSSSDSYHGDQADSGSERAQPESTVVINDDCAICANTGTNPLAQGST